MGRELDVDVYIADEAEEGQNEILITVFITKKSNLLIETTTIDIKIDINNITLIIYYRNIYNLSIFNQQTYRTKKNEKISIIIFFYNENIETRIKKKNE